MSILAVLICFALSRVAAPVARIRLAREERICELLKKMAALRVTCVLLLLLGGAQYGQAQCLSEQLAPPAPGQNYTQYISWLGTFRETMLNNLDYSGDLYGLYSCISILRSRDTVGCRPHSNGDTLISCQ